MTDTERYAILGLPEFFRDVVGGELPQLSKAGTADATRENLKVAFKSIRAEGKAYVDTLRRAFESALEGTEFVVKDAAERFSSITRKDKPEFALFDKPGAEAWQVAQGETYECTPAQERDQYLANVRYAWAVSIVQHAASERDDPFKEALDSQTGAGTVEMGDADTRAQITRHVSEIFLRQHRAFIFIVVICGQRARLMRWDRCGAILTRAFDFTEDPEPLLRFTRWLATASRAQQGFDTSVEPATGPQKEALQAFETALEKRLEATAKEAAKKSVQAAAAGKDERLPSAEVERLRILLGLVKEMRESETLYPIHQLRFTVLDRPNARPDSLCRKHTGKTFTLLIGKYHARNYSPCGRGTKGYMAYAPELHRLFFVKMGWRPNTPDVASELATYMKLYEKNVPYIPQVVGGGDVHHGLDDASRPCSSNDSPSAPLRTLAHKFLKVDGPGKIWERFQHRLVFETIGIPLGEYANAFAMIGAVFHAFLAHQRAWENAGILHRDVSVGNILIDISSNNFNEPRAVLSDWDLSKHKDKLRTATQSDRSGTWPFMSGPLLRYPLKPNELPDDIESFVHLFYYLILRYHYHSLSTAKNPSDPKVSLSVFVSNYFFFDEPWGKYVVGGRTKFEVFSKPTPPFTLTNARDTGLRAFFQSLHGLCHDHYLSIDEEALKEYLPPAEFFDSEDLGEWEYRPGRFGDEDLSQMAPARWHKSNPAILATQDKATVPRAPPAPPRPRDPFADHDALGTLLWGTLFGTPEDRVLKWGRANKTPDKFDGLQSLALVSDVPSSHNVNRTPKRSATTGDHAEESRAEKKRRTNNDSDEYKPGS